MNHPAPGTPQDPVAHGRGAPLAAWLERVCASVRGARRGVVVLGPPDVGPFAPVEFWPAGEGAAPALADAAEQALGERRPVADAVDGISVLAVPVEVEGHVHGVLALEVAGTPAPGPVLAQLREAVAWLQALVREESAQAALDTEGRLMAVLDLLGAVLEEDRFEAACRSLVTELAGRLQCDRASLGVVRAGRAEVLALSYSAQVGKRMNLIAAVGAAMDEALDQKTLVRYPLAEGEALVVLREHARLAAEHGNGSLLTVPMAGAGDFAGALCLERPAHLPFTREATELVQSVASVVARVLELKRRDERALALRAKDAAMAEFERLAGPRHVKRKLVVGAALLVALFLAFADGDYRVTAPATLEGAVRRTVAAPFDGYVATAPARAGDVAREGAVLATLDEREIRLERLKWASQYAQYLQQHQEAVANRDRAKAQIMQALYEQAEAQVALLDEQLARAAVKAPFEGVIVKGDLSQSLGAAVKRGDVLYEIAPLAEYRVIVNIDEREIADVAHGQPGTLILASIARESFRFRVTNVTAVTTAKEGRNSFRVEAMLEGAPERLRPGMEGVAKIEVDRRRLVWIWTHRLVNWVRLFVWTYLP